MNGPRPFLPTLAAVVLTLGAAFAAAAHLTLGFRAFTAEDARRLRVAESPLAISPVEVLDAAGRTRTLWNAEPGTRAWLVSFVYTRCPSACVALGSEFQQLQRSVLASGTNPRVRFASVSFDRAHDTSAELARYAERFKADPALWSVAVPATDAALARLLAETGVVVINDGLGGYAHNAAIHVITPSGRLVAIFDLERYTEAFAFAQTLPPGPSQGRGDLNPLAPLEGDMALHMLVEFPLLVAAGAALAHYAPRRIDDAIATFDRFGLVGWTLASLVAAYWMIPAAIDAALGSGAVNAVKYASLLAAGFALRGALRRSPFALEAFFVGNFTWMAATVGLIYQEAEVQLCLNYLADSQQRAGRGLVVLAVAVLVAWFALRPARVMPRVPAS